MLTLEAIDVDEDDLIFSAISYYPGGVTAEVTGNQLTLTPALDWSGPEVGIQVEVEDEEGKIWKRW